MLDVNYKHLHCGVWRTSEQLHLTPQTISSQMTVLEEALGNTKFAKIGRGKALTDMGRLVLGYAEEIS